MFSLKNLARKGLTCMIVSSSSGSLGVVFSITPQEELTTRLMAQIGSSVASVLNGATFILPDNTVTPVTGGTLFIQMEDGNVSNCKLAH